MIINGGKYIVDKISVIIPVYNVAAYLKGCLESVINQTFPNLEIILVNDGSTDNSLSICEQYQSRNSQIKIITQKNCGLSAARNRGIEAATGNYITFIDSDDWYSSINVLNILYQLLKKNNSDIVVSNFVEFDNHTNEYYTHVFSNTPVISTISPHQWMTKQYQNNESLSQCFSTAWGKLFRRDYFKNVRFPIGKIAEDDLTIWKLYLQAKKIVYTNQSLYVYRNHRTDSITAMTNNALLFSLPAIEERIAIEQFLGFSDIIPTEYNSYLWRLQTHRNHALNIGKLTTLKQAQQTINIINKHKHTFY